MNQSSTPIILWSPIAEQVESDCACPDRAFSLEYAGPISPGALFVQTKQTHTAALPHNFKLAFSPHAPGGPAVLNPAAWEHWQRFNQPRPLTGETDQILAYQQLIHPYQSPPKPVQSPAQTLTAWLHVTNACNLDCPYCYVRKSSARMSEAVGRQAVKTIFETAQRHNFRQVKLKYAGGEATLHFKLIRRLHQYAQRLADQAGITLRGVVLSNGVHLRPEDVAWLADQGVKLMISLDGIGEQHNQLRPAKNGRAFDTFSRVEKTIDRLLLPQHIRPDISMTVTRRNAHDAPNVAKWALIDRALPTSFNFYRQNILSASRPDLDLEENGIIEGMLAAYKMIEEHLPTHPFLEGLLDRVQSQAHAHTCGVGQNYLVVTHTGQLAQCQMHLDQPLGQIGEKETLPLIGSGPIQNIPVDHKEGCRDCEFRYRCTGGCPLETYRATGRWDVQSPNCHIYKRLMPAALRLEGLRLMKVNGHLH